VIEASAGYNASNAKAGAARLKPGPKTFKTEWAAPPMAAAINSMPTVS
jgi:hypothetical protein